MTRLLLCIHNHQPVGNFEHVIEEAYQKAYRPFFDALAKFPSVKVNFHFTGILYDWLERKHPDFLALIAQMVKTGQVEIMSGGYYEPPLAVLPRADRLGQIAKMNAWIERTFGARPRGMWLAERIWEPGLAKDLAEAGIEYTVLDDLHFFYGGLRESDLTGYYTAEYEGFQTAVFPINKTLRYLIPFKEPGETIAYLERFRHQGDAVFVMADDGEKFGLWPRTFDSVYGQKWLERFFSLLCENSGWLKTSLFSDTLDKTPSKGLCSLPVSSYFEFTGWALRPDAAARLKELSETASEDLLPFLRGGQFRDFIAKYPEVNRMYRKMLLVSKKVHALPEGELKTRALDFLWQAQCNCGYWHGVFGGVYLPHLRAANYSNLISAEKLADEHNRRSGRRPVFTQSHLDCDGDFLPETLIEGPEGSWYFNPARGGCMYEWDIKKRGVNFINNITRYREAYHSDVARAVVSDGGAILPNQLVAREPNLHRRIVYDWHGRNCLLDHFLRPGTRLNDFARAQYGEQGDFVLEPYKEQDCRVHDGSASVVLRRNGSVWCADRRVPVTVQKKVTLSGGAWKAEYAVRNNSDRAEKLLFGVETAFLFSSPTVCGTFEKHNVKEIEFVDSWYGDLKLSCDRACTVWGFPLETVSQSEGGFEMTYQGSVALFLHEIELPPAGELRFTLKADV